MAQRDCSGMEMSTETIRHASPRHDSAKAQGVDDATQSHAGFDQMFTECSGEKQTAPSPTIVLPQQDDPSELDELCEPAVLEKLDTIVPTQPKCDVAVPDAFSLSQASSKGVATPPDLPDAEARAPLVKVRGALAMGTDASPGIDQPDADQEQLVKATSLADSRAAVPDDPIVPHASRKPDVQNGSTGPTLAPDQDLLTQATGATTTVDALSAQDTSPASLALRWGTEPVGGLPFSGPQPHTPISAHGVRPDTLIAQIVERMDTAEGRKITIRLDPAELGSVRISFSGNDQALTAVLSVDRPETELILRRHADQLSSALRDAGYQGVSLEFASNPQGGDTRQQTSPAVSDPALEEVVSLAGSGTGITESFVPGNGKLDLRL